MVIHILPWLAADAGKFSPYLPVSQAFLPLKNGIAHRYFGCF